MYSYVKFLSSAIKDCCVCVMLHVRQCCVCVMRSYAVIAQNLSSNHGR